MTNEVKLYETPKFTNFLLIVIVILLVIFLVSYIIVARRAETIVVETTNTFSNIFRPFSQFMQNINNDIQNIPEAAGRIFNNPQTQQFVSNVQNEVTRFEQDLNMIIGRIQEIFSKKDNIKGKKHIVEAHMHQFNDLLNDIEKTLNDKSTSEDIVDEYKIHFNTIYDSLYENTKCKYLKFLALKNKF